MNALFSCLYWSFLFLSAAGLYLGALALWAVTAPFDPVRGLLHGYTCRWARLYLHCLPGCRVRVEGREKIRPGVPYVIVANHQSMADIMALSFLAVPFKWVSKKEAFRLPFIGWNMHLNGYVAVDRGNVRSVRATMDECRRWLDRGVPLVIFPEGTFSPDGEIQDFHGGAFKLAAETGCAIVPVLVDGTRPIYQGLRVWARPGVLTVRVLDPIPAGNAGAARLRDDVLSLMRRELAAIRGRAEKRVTSARAAHTTT